MERLFFIFSVAFLGLIGLSSCEKEFSCEDCNSPNRSPIAIAGPDRSITLPTNFVSLNGSLSSDPDGTITGYTWKKISGPPSYTIVRPTDAITDVNDLVPGGYLFELEVTDDEGLSAKDTIKIAVTNPGQPNQPPVADAGADRVITLPMNTTNLNGIGSYDPDNNIAGYTWSKISGPSSYNILNANAIHTPVSGLVAGIYLFELKVTDSGGLSDKDTLKVAVIPANTSGVDVYVCGGYGAPKYWKNGQESLLFPDLAGDDLASSIAVVGNDVYVAGDDHEFMYPGYSWPRYWKNGQEVRLTNGNSYAGTTSIAVAGNDVYVTGWEYLGANSLAVYWKNGQKIVLTNPLNEGSASDIAIVGNDVYISGDESYPSGMHVAKYWKNGQEVLLTNGTAGAYTTSIAVVGSDVYVSGYGFNGTASVAKYWKNGQEVVLASGAIDATTTAIAVVGNDVYVTGFAGDFHNSSYQAKYWKNGQEFYLPNADFATSITIYGTDVYIGGHGGGGQGARYWKNGQAVTLPNSFYATGIAVVQH